MRCLKCGKECGDENFCSHCGAPLVKNETMQKQKNDNSNYTKEPVYIPYENVTSQSNTNYNYMASGQQPKKSKSNIGIYALILGIAGLIFSCVSSFGILLDIAGIVVGIVGIVQKNKKGCATAGIICGIIGLFIFMITISGDSADTNSEAIENTQPIVSTESAPSTEKPADSQREEKKKAADSQKKEKKKKAADSQKGKEKKKTAEKKETENSEEKFKKSCQKFDYKKIARNPDEYMGQNFKVTVQIYSVSEGSLFTEAYMKAYTDDGSGTYFDNMIYLFDEQDKDSKSYVNILEDDVVTIYGTFEGMEDSTNFLNGEKSKDIALHIKYAKLIKE